MNVLESMRETLRKVGLQTRVAEAPTGAVTFDKMLIVYADPNCKMIRQVQLYNSKDGKFVGSFS